MLNAITICSIKRKTDNKFILCKCWYLEEACRPIFVTHLHELKSSKHPQSPVDQSLSWNEKLKSKFIQLCLWPLVNVKLFSGDQQHCKGNSQKSHGLAIYMQFNFPVSIIYSQSVMLSACITKIDKKIDVKVHRLLFLFSHKTFQVSIFRSSLSLLTSGALCEL